jgi:hypothetical protein
MTDAISPGSGGLGVLPLLTGIRMPIAFAVNLIGGVGTMMLSASALLLSPLNTRASFVTQHENAPHLSKGNA